MRASRIFYPLSTRSLVPPQYPLLTVLLAQRQHDGGHRGGEEEQQRDGVATHHRPKINSLRNPLVVHVVRSIYRMARGRYPIGDIEGLPRVCLVR